MATKLSTSLLGRSVKLGMNMEQRVAQINAWRQANPGKTFTGANQPPELSGKILVRDDYQKHAGKLGAIVSVFLLDDSPRYTIAVAGDLVELGPNEFELVETLTADKAKNTHVLKGVGLWPPKCGKCGEAEKWSKLYALDAQKITTADIDEVESWICSTCFAK